MRGKRAVRLQFATRRQLLWGRKWDVELLRLSDQGGKRKKERIIIKKMKGRGSSLIGSLQASGCMNSRAN